MTESLDSPQAIILGGGIGKTADGQTVLSLNSLARVDRAIELHRSNPLAFDRQGGVIVCTGNASLLSEEVYSRSEASLVADLLLDAEIPVRLIETEEVSHNTLTNFLNNSELLDDKAREFNGDSEPVLSVVTQSWHYRPRAHFLGSITLDRPMQNAVATGEADLRRRAQEVALYSGYRLLLSGIRAGDRDAISQRSEEARRIVNLLKSLIVKDPKFRTPLSTSSQLLTELA